MSRYVNVSLRKCPVTQVSCNLINRNAEFQAKRLNFAFVIIAQFLYSKSSARTFLFSNRSNILRGIRQKSTSRRNRRLSVFSSSRIEADYWWLLYRNWTYSLRDRASQKIGRMSTASGNIIAMVTSEPGQQRSDLRLTKSSLSPECYFKQCAYCGQFLGYSISRCFSSFKFTRWRSGVWKRSIWRPLS